MANTSLFFTESPIKKVEEKTQFKKISVQTSAVVFFVVEQRIALALTTFNYCR